MLFFPVTFFIFLIFILLLPILFGLGSFQILTIGFEKLGIPFEASLILLFAILLGSAVNIPLSKKKIISVRESRFFGLWQKSKLGTQGIFINVGGAIIPILLSFYFLYLSWKLDLAIKPILIAVLIMIVIAKILAKVIPNRGVSLPVFAPPIVSAILALILAPDFAAPCAFVAGTLGVLIGADLLNLRKIQKYRGSLSIGGAGVFDGIFLVGIISALLAGF